MLIYIPNCSLMFTLWNGLTMHAWMCCLWDVTQVSVQELPVCECFKDPRINNTEGGTELSYSATFGERKLWVQCFLDLETFEAIHSCHQEWTRGAHQVDPRRSGILFNITTLRKTFGCAILRSCLRVSPTPMRIRRSSPNNAGGCAAVLSSPPPGAVKTPTNQVYCNVPYNFPRMSIRLRSSRCGTHHNAETKLAPVFQSQCSKGQESLPFPPEPMLRRNKKD